MMHFQSNIYPMISKLEPWVKRSFLFQRNVHVVKDMVGNMVSSTAVRNEIGAGYSVRQMVPNSVIQYINANKLYNLPQE